MKATYQSEERKINMATIIKCRFLSENDEPRGREYSYISEIPVEVGQYVDVPAPRHSDVEVKSEVAAFAGQLKTIIGIHKEDEK